MPVQPAIKIDGLKALQREVRKAKDSELNAEMKKANRAAAQVAVDAGKPKAPRRSGALAKTVKAANSSRYAAIKAGSPARVPYAGVIHFGWPRRNIRPQKFLDEAIRQEWKRIEETYREAIEGVARLLESKK